MNHTIDITLRLVNQLARPLKEATAGITTAVTGIKAQMKSMTENMRWASLFVGAALLKVTKNVLDLGGTFQSFSIMAEYMTGNAEAADKMAKSIKSMALESIFGIDQITELSKRLIGNTRHVDISEKALRALMDAVAATGGGYSELESATRAWIQTNAKGKASAEEMNRQFANANIPVLRSLAESIVKDLNHPLRKYLQIAGEGGATGASKTLATAFKSASKRTRYLGEEIRIAQEKLKGYEGNSKIAKTTIDSLELSIRKKTDILKEDNATIDQYTKAQAGAGKATKAVTLSVEDVLKQLQNIGELNIPGTIAAEAITRALNEAYGGANQKLVATFKGQLEKFADVVKLVALSFLGLDENFRVIEGGVFSKLTGIITKINDLIGINQQKIIDLGKAFGNSLGGQLSVVTFLFGILYGALSGIMGPVFKVGFIFGGLGMAIGAVVDLIKGDLFDLLGETPKKFGDMATASYDVKERLFSATGKADNFSQAIDGISVSMDNGAQNWQEYQDKLETAKEKIKPTTEAFDELKQTVGKIDFEPAKQALGELANAFFGTQASADELRVAGITALIYVLDFLVIILGQIVTLWIPLVIKGYAAWMEANRMLIASLTGNDQAFQESFTKLDGILTSSHTLWTTYWDNYFATNVAGFSNNATTTAGITQNMCSDITQNYSSMASSAEGSMTKLYSSATNSADLTKTGVNASFSKMSTEAVTTTDGMITNVSKAIDNAKPTIEACMSSSITKPVIASFSKASTDAGTQGKNLITNYINGIIARAKELVTRHAIFAGFGGLGTLAELATGGLEQVTKQHGGIVPGNIGEAVPIIAHGGERVTPSTGADVNGDSGGVTINISGSFNLDSSSRVNELANRISDILGRRMELAQLGAGW